MDITNSEESGKIKKTQENNNLSLDNLKSFFYLYNAKPDTEIRLLKGKKIIELSDIKSVEEIVADKLGNHEVIQQKVSINFILSNNKIKDFSLWGEFERQKWNLVNEKTSALTMQWNMLIKLPQYESPQTHSMKLRIGNAIPPKDIFQIFLTSDDSSELMEIRSSGVCKVDFINNIIANELLSIIEEWYERLKDCPEEDFIDRFIKKRGGATSRFIRIISPLLLLIICSCFSEYIFAMLKLNQQFSALTLQGLVIYLFSVALIGQLLGSILEGQIDMRIGQLGEHPIFLITKGDTTAVEKFKKNNSRLSKEIIFRVSWLFVTVPATIFIRLLLDYFYKAQ